jgi:hypothetical protein
MFLPCAADLDVWLTAGSRDTPPGFSSYLNDLEKRT